MLSRETPKTTVFAASKAAVASPNSCVSVVQPGVLSFG